jgi:hypothetical protein
MVMLRGEDTYANLPNKTVGSSLVCGGVCLKSFYTHMSTAEHVLTKIVQAGEHSEICDQTSGWLDPPAENRR